MKQVGGKITIRNPCSGLWKTPTIASNGLLTVCCADVDLNLIIAELEKEDFHESWMNSVNLNFYRLCHILGLFHLIPQCHNCLNLNWRKITQKEIVDYVTNLKDDTFNQCIAKLKNYLPTSILEQGKSGIISFYLNRISSTPFNYSDSMLQVEFTDQCNLNCYFCPQSEDKPHGTKKGFMNFEVFKKIIDDCVKYNIRFGVFEPFWLGEPLLHPNFKKLFQYYLNKKHKISSGWQLDTNAILLTKELSKFILQENNNFPSRIHFSIDSCSKETYKAMRNSDQFERMIQNIKDLMQIKSNLKLDFPELVFQFIVTKENQHETELFKDYWLNEFKELNIGGRIFYKKKDGGDEKENLTLFNKVNIDQEYEILFKRFEEQPREYTQPLNICAAPFKSLIIDKEGNATVCCVDINLRLKIGSFVTQNIDEIWLNNPKLDEIREKMVCGSSLPPLCEKCVFKNSPNLMSITKNDIQGWLKTQKMVEIKNASFLKSKWLKDHWWLTLELNGTCNLKCPMCSQYVSQINGGAMVFEDLKKTINYLIKKKIQFRNLTPFYRGESLLHPQIKEILDYLIDISKENLFRTLTLHTNANLLTKEISTKLLSLYNSHESGELFFSLDAASQTTYNKIRKGGNLIKTQNNIIELIKQKELRNQKSPYLIFQFIVMDENIDEVIPFTKFWTHILKQYNQDFIISKTEDRLLDVNQYKTNIIYFRRKEGTPQEAEHSLELQKQAYKQLEDAGFELK